MNLSVLDAAGRRERAQEERADIEEAFSKFCSGGDGYLRPADLRRVLLTLGLRLTDSELLEVVQQADENKDGLIDFQEFLKMMMQEEAPPSGPKPTDPSRAPADPSQSRRPPTRPSGVVSLDSLFTTDNDAKHDAKT